MRTCRGIAALELAQGQVALAAERALEVAEHHHGDRRVDAAAHRCIAELDLEALGLARGVRPGRSNAGSGRRLRPAPHARARLAPRLAAACTHRPAPAANAGASPRSNGAAHSRRCTIGVAPRFARARAGRTRIRSAVRALGIPMQQVDCRQIPPLLRRRAGRRRRPQPLGASRRGARAHRPQRCRQEHDPARARHPAASRCRARCAWDGADAWEDRFTIRRRIGFLGDGTALYPSMTGGRATCASSPSATGRTTPPRSKRVTPSARARSTCRARPTR